MELAQKAWELENAVEIVDRHRDALYGYDEEEQKAISDAQPWKKDPHHFKHVRIAAVALLKMVMHARSGGSLEIMGLMQGKVSGDTVIVTDAFRLPVEGTETRVNAGAQADEYQVNYLSLCRDHGRPDNAVGWYHSHPGYGCWLSGIDVNTQMLQQSYQDPYIAVVIDPDRTISAGRVDIGAFRTFPEDYNKPTITGGGGGGSSTATDSEGYQTIPLAKIEDFGAHASKYYALDVTHFKSSLDAHLLEALWNKYWVSTLSQSPLVTNRDYGTKQMADLGDKIRAAERAVSSVSRLPSQRLMGPGGGLGGGGGGSGASAAGGGGGGGAGGGSGTGFGGVKDAQLDKVVRDGNKIANEEVNGLYASEVKMKLFPDPGRVQDVKP